MPANFTAVRAGTLRAELGETPRIDARSGELIWTDITGGMVYFGAVTATGIELLRSHSVAGMAGPVTPLPDPGTGWIMARGDEIVHLAQDGAIHALIAPEAGQQSAFNDGVADPAGNLWVGSMGKNGITDAGRLWRFDTAGNGKVALNGIGISNGLDFSNDGRCAYYIDTSTRVLRRFNIDPQHGIVGSTDVLTFPLGEGDPDGLVIDEEGCIWVALWEGWAVQRYSPKGELLAVVHVPVARPTAVALAGEKLIITSCSGWLDAGWEQSQPDAGKLFSADVGVSGPPALPYRGPLSLSIADAIPAVQDQVGIR